MTTMPFNGTHPIGLRQDIRQAVLSVVDQVLNETRSSPFVFDPLISSTMIGATAPSSSLYPTRSRSDHFGTYVPTSVLNQHCLSSISGQSPKQPERGNAILALSTSLSNCTRYPITYPGSRSFLAPHLQESFPLSRLQNGSLTLQLPQLCSRRMNLTNLDTFDQNQRYLLQSLNNASKRNQQSRDHITLSSHMASDLAQPQKNVLDVKKLAQELLQNQQQSTINALMAIGSRARERTELYIDVLSLNLMPAPSCPARIGETFPEKLHRMLRESEDGDVASAGTGGGFSDVVSFLPHGRVFVVHDVERFLREIMPRYFPQQTQWRSFTRQLHLWGFLSMRSGPGTMPSAAKTDFAGGTTYGARFTFYHELFLQCRPDLCVYMRRVGASTGAEDRRKFRKLKIVSVKLKDPDFYMMRPATHGKP